MLISKAPKVQIQQEPYVVLKAEMQLCMATLIFFIFRCVWFVCDIWGIFPLKCVVLGEASHR